jgi:predicted nucleic acid-binding protein
LSALRAVFVATGAWVALRYGRDQYHERARALLRRLRADDIGLVTTEWVWPRPSPS